MKSQKWKGFILWGAWICSIHSTLIFYSCMYLFEWWQRGRKDIIIFHYRRCGPFNFLIFMEMDENDVKSHHFWALVFLTAFSPFSSFNLLCYFFCSSPDEAPWFCCSWLFPTTTVASNFIDFLQNFWHFHQLLYFVYKVQLLTSNCWEG